MIYDARRRLMVVKTCPDCVFSDRGEIWSGYCHLHKKPIPKNLDVDKVRPRWCPLDTTKGVTVKGSTIHAHDKNKEKEVHRTDGG